MAGRSIVLVNFGTPQRVLAIPVRAGSETFSIHVALNPDYPDSSRCLLRFLDRLFSVIWTGLVNDPRYVGL